MSAACRSAAAFAASGGSASSPVAIIAGFASPTPSIFSIDATSNDGSDGKWKSNDGIDGKDGKDGIAGLYYVTATYGTDVANNPNVSVNEGAIATVACKDPADHAVAGGVQTLGIDGGRAAAVASSFPGRMDWDTNTPKANRFDGWIVQFDARQAPVKANIWVTCATGTTIPQFEVPVS